MKKLVINILAYFLLAPVGLWAQSDTALIEKAYLYTDQESYLTGEYIWFSAYLIEASTGKFSDLSKVMYVEILTSENEPVLQTKIQLNHGAGHGSLFLPASLVSGEYHIRAYTRWMRNRPAHNYFHKTIHLFNPFIPIPPTESYAENSDISARFFPEGGQMIQDIPARVGFQVTGSDGRGIPFRGLVLTQEGDTVLRFVPLKFGMGHFEFTPKPDFTYRAVLRDVYDSLLASIPLPEIKDQGVSLRVEPQNDGYRATVYCPGYPDGTTLKISIRNDSGTEELQSVRSANGLVRLTIPKEDIPTGISWVVVDDPAGNLSSERAVFKYQTSETVSIRVDKSNIGTRNKVSFTVNADTLARLSMSVFRLDKLYQTNNVTMPVAFTLTSSLPGTIENPAFYFSDDPIAEEALDNLLMIHGWTQIRRTETPQYLPEFRGQLITATINAPDNRNLTNTAFYLSLPGQPFTFRTALADSLGKIRFQARNVRGKRPLIIRPADLSDSMLTVSTNPQFSAEFAPQLPGDFTVSADLKESLEARSLGMQMENIYFGSEKGDIKSFKEELMPFYGVADKIYLLDDFTRFPSMLDVMKEYVYSVAARKRNGAYVFRVFDEEGNRNFNEPPLTLLDGVPIVDASKIINYDPLLVEKIEVITGRYVYGPMSFPGIVSFTTYKGTLDGFDLGTTATEAEYEGVQYERIFYSPVYTTGSENMRKPDMRTLLHWAPGLRTDVEGNNNGSFYTSDRTGTYLIRIEGLTEGGIPMYGELEFEVTPEIFSEK